MGPKMVKMKELNTVTVDGVEFLWRIERNPQWCTVDGWKGAVLHVESAINKGRCLKIEFPFELRDHKSAPQRQRPKISASTLSECIQNAISAGWDPSSRGKAFRYPVIEKEDAS